MSNDSTTWTYTYDANGMRIGKGNGVTNYTYVYSGTQLIEMTSGWDKLLFTYDAEGRPLTVEYRDLINCPNHSESSCTSVCQTYYYVTNLQGDVIALLNDDGYPVVEYAYDAWGNVVDAEDNSGKYLAMLNPLRYRGYVYDRETGLYYLQSRYYNPEIGRFISADNYPSTGQCLTGNNMFAYCGNNPVVRIDSNGEAFETVFDIISLAGSIIDVAINPMDPWAWASLAGDTLDLIPILSGSGESIRAIEALVKAGKVLDNGRHAMRVADDILDITGDVAKGWKLGDPIDALTKAGNIPSWNTIRQRYWKTIAYLFPDEVGDQLHRLQKGKALLDADNISIHLHHPNGRAGVDLFTFGPIRAFEHMLLHSN